MNIYLNIALALIAGTFAGSVVNMTIVEIGPLVIALPEAIDKSSMDSMIANAHLLEPKHYLFPLLAHAFGTYCGALVAYYIAKRYKGVAAMLIGFVFFVGGVTAVMLIPAPIDFILIDLIFAYFPMAYAAIKTLQPHPAIQKIEDRNS